MNKKVTEEAKCLLPIKMERRQNQKSRKVSTYLIINFLLQILKLNFLTDTPFSQQQLPAWQPILTPGTVLPTFFVIGIAFLAIGVGLLYFSNDVKEKVIEYTDCTNSDGKMCHDVINKTEDTSVPKCECKVQFTLEEDWPKDVYMYYALTNFYQNHRRYVKSRDEKQLLGDIEKIPDDDCNPYEKVEGFPDLPVVPCGAIANSLFNGKLRNRKSVENILKVA